ncbi:hypothetical protein [Nonomuraea salmonea]|uniref:hypothetical protein n=1 Tax=Nonomuraea salmonea TaxID=46181 RepID=UPI002FEB566F
MVGIAGRESRTTGGAVRRFRGGGEPGATAGVAGRQSRATPAGAGRLLVNGPDTDAAGCFLVNGPDADAAGCFLVDGQEAGAGGGVVGLRAGAVGQSGGCAGRGGGAVGVGLSGRDFPGRLAGLVAEAGRRLVGCLGLAAEAVEVAGLPVRLALLEAVDPGGQGQLLGLLLPQPHGRGRELAFGLLERLAPVHDLGGQ